MTQRDIVLTETGFEVFPSPSLAHSNFPAHSALALGSRPWPCLARKRKGFSMSNSLRQVRRGVNDSNLLGEW